MSQDVDDDGKNAVHRKACEDIPRDIYGDIPIDHCDDRTSKKCVETSESENKLEEFNTERMSSKNLELDFMKSDNL